jgi:hypothetical protein
MHCRPCAPIALLLVAATLIPAADWPQWRWDAQRSGESPEALPAELYLQWVRALPPLTPAFKNPRLHFDAGYEPVVLGETVFVASSANDSVAAYDLATGAERWKVYTDGPLRFAPAAWNGRVFAGSDDGCLWCLDAATGKTLWRLRAAPSGRKLLGNRRLISAWPVRGGPVVDGGRVYFAAGVWPFEGVFVYAVDAASGEVLWVNDRAGFVYGKQPHDAEGFSGLSPQGYLVADGDDLVVPCGSAYPAVFDRATGALKSFSLPSASRHPGGWFAMVASDEAKARRRGKLIFDSDVNSERHEDNLRRGDGEAGARSTVSIGGRRFAFAGGVAGVEGPVHSVLAASGRLLVVTRDGTLHCFGAKPVDPIRYARQRDPATTRPVEDARRWAQRVLDATSARRGYALVWGLGDGGTVAGLLAESELHVIGVDPDAGHVDELRRRFDAAGLYGRRVSLHAGDPAELGWPPYLASLVICASAPPPDPDAERLWLRALFQTLRPYGGAACMDLESDSARIDRIEKLVALGALSGAELRRETAGLTVLIRRGALPGATDYTGGWSSPDALVSAPLGVLWFDDALGHFKRSPQPSIAGGVMVSYPKEWQPLVPRPVKGVDYELGAPVFSDIYTGRVLAEDELRAARAEFPPFDPKQPQPVQYRPPSQKDAWKPEPPVAGTRRCPLTGTEEPRTFPKSYGCDGGIDYGFLYTMRSATPSFYDKTLESGTVNLSGPRSGCTNSVIPAGGLLNVPYFYEGCTCSYPLPCGMALVAMPEEHEQWMAWGPGPTARIRRVGLNLGAPGDRMTRAGTLWLDVPSAGGPSPEVEVSVEPETPAYFYRHSMWIRGGRGWPWVVASGAEGIASLRLRGLKPGAYTVRLYFAEPRLLGAGERVFDVEVQSLPARSGLDVARAAGGALRGHVEELCSVRIEGQLAVQLSPRKGATLLSGVEVVEEGLILDELPPLLRPAGEMEQLWRAR